MQQNRLGRITIRDVAREAGVSITTVSHALSGQGALKQETRDRVMEVARRMQYTPDWIGKNLKSAQTGMLGFFTYTMMGFYGILADALSEECRACGYEMEIFIIDGEERLCQILMGRHVDGAVILHSCVQAKQEEMLHDMGFPVVYLDREIQDERASSVLFDSYQCGRMAAEYLYSLGYRRIMDMRGVYWTYDGSMRQKGFEDFMREKGLPIGEEYTLDGLFDRDKAYQAMKRFLAKGLPLPEAVFAANDDSAFGCISALYEAGYSVPDDVGVIGCDDIEVSRWYVPALTTMRTHIEKQGSLAMRELVRLLKREKTGEIYKIPAELIERDSCRRS